MTIDHRQDDELAEFNCENLNINYNNIIFHNVTSVSKEKFSGNVYDLKIKNHKNYITKLRIYWAKQKPLLLC